MVDAGGGSDATDHVRRSPEAPTMNVNKEDGIPKVVVNELRCFVQDKMNMLPSDDCSTVQ